MLSCVVYCFRPELSAVLLDIVDLHGLGVKWKETLVSARSTYMVCKIFAVFTSPKYTYPNADPPSRSKSWQCQIDITYLVPTGALRICSKQWLSNYDRNLELFNLDLLHTEASDGHSCSYFQFLPRTLNSN